MGNSLRPVIAPAQGKMTYARDFNIWHCCRSSWERNIYPRDTQGPRRCTKISYHTARVRTIRYLCAEFKWSSTSNRIGNCPIFISSHPDRFIDCLLVGIKCLAWLSHDVLPPTADENLLKERLVIENDKLTQYLSDKQVIASNFHPYICWHHQISQLQDLPEVTDNSTKEAQAICNLIWSSSYCIGEGKIDSNLIPDRPPHLLWISLHVCTELDLLIRSINGMSSFILWTDLMDISLKSRRNQHLHCVTLPSRDTTDRNLIEISISLHSPSYSWSHAFPMNDRGDVFTSNRQIINGIASWVWGCWHREQLSMSVSVCLWYQSQIDATRRFCLSLGFQLQGGIGKGRRTLRRLHLSPSSNVSLSQVSVLSSKRRLMGWWWHELTSHSGRPLREASDVYARHIRFLEKCNPVALGYCLGITSPLRYHLGVSVSFTMEYSYRSAERHTDRGELYGEERQHLESWNVVHRQDTDSHMERWHTRGGPDERCRYSSAVRPLNHGAFHWNSSQIPTDGLWLHYNRDFVLCRIHPLTLLCFWICLYPLWGARTWETFLWVFQGVQKQTQERIDMILSHMRGNTSICKVNNLHKLSILEAMISWVEGRTIDVISHLEDAAEQANEALLIQYEVRKLHEISRKRRWSTHSIQALANELSSQVWERLGKKRYVDFHQKEALRLYDIWGSKMKVSQLSSSQTVNHPSLGSPNLSDVESLLDMEVSRCGLTWPDIWQVVTKVTKVVTADMNLEQMLNAMLKLLIQNSAAQRGEIWMKARTKPNAKSTVLFLLPDSEGELLLIAEGDSSGFTVNSLRVSRLSSLVLYPHHVINRVAKSQTQIIVDRASEDLSVLGIDIDQYIQVKFRYEAPNCIYT